jgi:ribosomal protein L23
MIIKSPKKTEKSLRGIEKDNTIQFEVSGNATKKQVKDEIEKLLNVKVHSVRTKIGPDGKKHAFVRLEKGSNADEVATKLKMIT